MKRFRRVLIVAPYGIGDMLFLTPVLRALRLVPTVEKVDLVVGSRTHVVLRSNPHVDEIFPVDKDYYHQIGPFRVLTEMVDLGRKLRQNRYDLLVDYSMRGEYGFASQFLFGIPVRTGFAYKKRGFFLTHRVSVHQGFYGKHVVDYYCEVAEKVGVPVQDRFLEFFLEEKDHCEADQRLKEKNLIPGRFVVLSLGGGESWGKDATLKRWPVRSFVKFTELLKRRNSWNHIVLVGSPTESNLAEEYKRLSNIPTIDLTGQISLPVVAAILEKARLFIGNDGGLVHISRALNVAMIAFYGPVDSVVYGPYPPSKEAAAIVKKGLDCRPCYNRFRYRTDCVDHQCLQDLTPEEAIKDLEKMKFM